MFCSYSPYLAWSDNQYLCLKHVISVLIILYDVNITQQQNDTKLNTALASCPLVRLLGARPPGKSNGAPLLQIRVVGNGRRFSINVTSLVLTKINTESGLVYHTSLELYTKLDGSACCHLTHDSASPSDSISHNVPNTQQYGVHGVSGNLHQC